jgi:FkbM family methyltransferase
MAKARRLGSTAGWKRRSGATLAMLAARPMPTGVDGRGSEKMQSFSQHGQDKFVLEAFFKDRKKSGVFVEIGAYDGVTFSNTLLFERLGWRGLCIEPMPSAFQKLTAARSAVCINCAVADNTGTGTFLEVDMPSGFEKMYSGLKANFDERHKNTIQQWGKNPREIKVPIRRLGEILDEQGMRRVDYMSIDTEGSEWKILRSFDFGAFDVRVLSVENNYQDEKIRKHLAGNGYRLVNVFAEIDELYAKPDSN